MTDTLKTLKCPACQKEMMKIFIPSEGVNLDVCLNGCGGIYFDTREYNYFDEPHENIEELLAAMKGKTFKKVDESLPRSCPACGARMTKHFASGKMAVQIDDCYFCGGKFLDNGELQKIRAEYKTQAERDEASVKLLYNVVGAELRAHQKETEEAKKFSSYFKRVFDAIMGF